jgi:hypothetical protein
VKAAAEAAAEAGAFPCARCAFCGVDDAEEQAAARRNETGRMREKARRIRTV